MTDMEILDKCALRMSEWLTRPHIAISEFSSSIYENKVFTEDAVSYLVDKIRPLGNALQQFNTKDTTLAEEPDTTDLCKLMKTVNDPDLVVMTKELFAAGGALYHMAAQLMVLQKLSKHPKDWAAEHCKTPEVAPFKANPTPEGLRQYLETMLLRQTPSSTMSSSGVDVWSSNEPGTTTQHPSSTVVWDQVDNQQQPRLLRPQSIWEADNERPGTSARSDPFQRYRPGDYRT